MASGTGGKASPFGNGSGGGPGGSSGGTFDVKKGTGPQGVKAPPFDPARQKNPQGSHASATDFEVGPSGQSPPGGALPLQDASRANPERKKEIGVGSVGDGAKPFRLGGKP